MWNLDLCWRQLLVTIGLKVNALAFTENVLEYLNSAGYENCRKNKAVIDCHLCCYIKHTSFLCRYIRRDIMCKHDIINIQHSHCSLVGPTAESSPERPLPETGIFTRQSQGCVSASLAASAWRRHRATSELMCKYDVIHKREIRNVSLRRQRTTEQWPQVTCSKIWWWPDVWFRRYNDRSHRQTRSSQYSAPYCGLSN